MAEELRKTSGDTAKHRMAIYSWDGTQSKKKQVTFHFVIYLLSYISLQHYSYLILLYDYFLSFIIYFSFSAAKQTNSCT